MSDRKMMLLTANGPSSNRGCEAIERGTLEVLAGAGWSGAYAVAPFGVEESGVLERKDVVRLRGRSPDARFGTAWIARRLRGLGRDAAPESTDYCFSFNWLNGVVGRCHTVLSLGGDNYTLDYGRPEAFFAFNDWVLRRGKRLAIWGASVGRFGPDERYECLCAERLRQVTWILAREDETVEYLRSIGVEENVHRVSDPAFVMRPEKPNDPRLSASDLCECVGLNVSPLFAGFVGEGVDWEDVCVDVVRRVVDELRMRVVLVPHVTVPHCNDWEFMRRVATRADRGKMVMLVPPSLNAPETKWVIGRLRLFAGARMHSTVASLSMGVPTLSLAYSHKSIGINRDIFGHTRYVLTSRETSARSILDGLAGLAANETEVRAEIQLALPGVLRRSRHAGELVLGDSLGG